nr:Chain A, peptide from Alzheimer's A-beta [synthetic construct]2OKZ_B Chain B, peptide from Alzheimer's A-beta [synthetic construct]2ONA_A Chain A, MVGGVV peptide derived from Alzheimer's A-beta, residues 35-40 [unidentified]2ONA_B Chain B, MVGGVV peptide derived from Alzheimer's A-beta, residues 35-40 [unidentified]2ONA_C Chain C, MVGGVV peptide derived from Alzheimer's A-beta, residues 35-40 [unidentified]2ONA_D Chain D, MVGGVV peptide derived from Alzheimer's A-beta, residues 35-40 [unide
MVGGVV